MMAYTREMREAKQAEKDAALKSEIESKIKKELEKYNADPANNPPLMDENGHEVVFP